MVLFVQIAPMLDPEWINGEIVLKYLRVCLNLAIKYHLDEKYGFKLSNLRQVYKDCGISNSIDLAIFEFDVMKKLGFILFL